MPVRILVADDQEAIRRGIRSLLSCRSDWLICGEATDGYEATELARELRPDVILMDLSMPRMDGIEATCLIRQELPESRGSHCQPERPRRLVSTSSEDRRSRLGCQEQSGVGLDTGHPGDHCRPESCSGWRTRLAAALASVIARLHIL